MAKSVKNLASGSLSTTDLTPILTILQGRNVLVYTFVMTNTTSTIITVDIYINDGTDRLFEKVKIPAGNGKIISVASMKGVTLEGNQVVKIQADSASTFNYKMNGDEQS